MVRIGNHLKMNVPERLRARTREFYGTLLECRSLERPRPDLDLYELSDGFVLGLFFTDEAETLSDADYLKATWMELKVEDPRFFFQAPGGQVFRVASLDGGL